MQDAYKMFSEQFMKGSGSQVPSHTRYRHRLQDGGTKKQDTAAFSSNFEVPIAKHSATSKMNFLPRYFSVDSKYRRDDFLVPSSRALCNSKFGTSFDQRNHAIRDTHQPAHQPLLKKRCNSQTSLATSKVDCLVQFKSPMHKSPMKEETTAAHSCCNDIEGHCISYRTIKTAQSTNSVLAVPGMTKTYERSASIDLGPHCACSKLHVPLKYDSDYHLRRFTDGSCNVLKLPSNQKVMYLGVLC